LGDNVLPLAPGVSFAILASETDAWPNKSARDLGCHFKGYSLTPDNRPTFLYEVYGARVEDSPDGVAAKSAPTIRRIITLSGAINNLYYRAAVADKIEALGDGWYRINNDWKMRIEGDAAPRIRPANGKMELLAPMRFENGKSRIVQEYAW
jgi:hypothetical protein